jgi:hypothetical protein
MADQRDEKTSTEGRGKAAVRAFLNVQPEPTDPRAKEAALMRLRDAPDEQLAVFEDKLRGVALEAGASEQEIRDAQRAHPEHGG